jgi:hypothetical protein
MSVRQPFNSLLNFDLIWSKTGMIPLSSEIKTKWQLSPELLLVSPYKVESLGFFSANIASIMNDAKEKDRSGGIFDLDQKMNLFPCPDPAQGFLGDSKERGYVAKFGPLKNTGVFLHQGIVSLFGALKFHGTDVG